MKSARSAHTQLHTIVLTWLLLLCGTSAWGEEAGTATPYMTSADRMADPTPKAWAMGHAAEASMDYASGTATMGMDLMSWKVGAYTMGLGLQYQLRAYKCREESGWVGLGWSLTGTGVITRTIAGMPDEFRGYDCRNHNDINDNAAGREYLKRIEEKEVDAQLDRYSYSFPGGSGQFVILNGKVVQLPQSDNTISAYGSDAAGVSTFVITTPDGMWATGRDITALSCGHAGRRSAGFCNTVSEVTFDSLGRVSTVTSQGDIVRSTQYDLRGMVRAWSTPAVSQRLMYTDGTVPSYTGRVSSKLTDAGAQFHSRYDYSYDKLGRLVAANQQDIDAADADFSTNYAYDLESNITRLQRRGKTAPTQYGLINDITATYSCGQITSQSDECETGTYEGNLTLTPIQSGSIQPTGLPTSAGSDSGSDSENDSNACTYDADGRLIKDPSRGIANIVYNEIGMPQKVLFNSGAYIGYIYLANGKKVEQKTAPARLTPGQFSRVVPVTTIYDESFEISLGSIKRLNVPGGYVTPRDSVFHLYVPDYQGNNVAVINTETGQAEQLTDYYPYGQPINNGLGASINPYKYGGKELLTANGYNASDFAARWLSHSLPCFQSPDPLAILFQKVCLSEKTKKGPVIF